MKKENLLLIAAAAVFVYVFFIRKPAVTTVTKTTTAPAPTVCSKMAKLDLNGNIIPCGITNTEEKI